MNNHAGTLNEYLQKQKFLNGCLKEIETAIQMIVKSVENGGKLLVCGNGGSCGDADHIVGECVKGFLKKRYINSSLKEKLLQYGEMGADLVQVTQEGIEAFNLGSHTSLITAITNDIGGEYIFSQQIAAIARENDVVLCISTSGNSKNILNAAIMAKAKGSNVIGMTGISGGQLQEYSDCCIKAPSDVTHYIQDMHTSIYHIICATIEEYFWDE